MADTQATESAEVATEAAPTVDMEASTAETLELLQQPSINDFQAYVDPTPLGKGEATPEEPVAEEPAEEPEAEEEEPTEETEEPKEGEEEAEEEPEGSAASGWAKVRKREMRLRELDSKMKMREQELKETMARVQHQEKAVNDFRAKIQKDPLSALQEAGYTFETLARQIINGEIPTPETAAGEPTNPQIEAMMQQMQQMQDRMNQREAAIEELGLKSQAQQALSSEDFALLNTAEDPVGEVIAVQRHYQSQGQFISAQDAAEMLQQKYVDQLQKLGQNEVIRNLLLGDSAGRQSTGEGRASQVKKPMVKKPSGSAKTLSNNLAAAPMAPVDLDQTYSEADEIAMALRLADLA